MRLMINLSVRGDIRPPTSPMRTHFAKNGESSISRIANYGVFCTFFAKLPEHRTLAGDTLVQFSQIVEKLDNIASGLYP